MTDTADHALAALRALANPDKAQFFARYFQTGPGQYGAGDRFLGLTVPQVRAQAQAFRALALPECVALLHQPYNEARLMALLLLVQHYQRRRTSAAWRQQVVDTYLAERAWVNNWNLVDSSAPHILGAHLLALSPQDATETTLLAPLARSPVLWERRMAVVATLAFIRANVFTPTLHLCAGLLADREDLMHKACGWMLREVGKRDEAALRAFLDAHAAQMPRTMLRYALEKLPPAVRADYMAARNKPTPP